MSYKKTDSIPLLQKLNVQPLFPTNIKIKDFGYPANSVNYNGTHLNSYSYDGVSVIGADYNSDDELPIIAKNGDPDNRISESDGDIYDEDDEDENDDKNDDGDEQETDGIIPDEINRKAIALFDFNPENDNEVPLIAGQIIWISYRHGQGWLVAEDPKTRENGLVPEEYVEIYYDNKEIFEDLPSENLLDNLDQDDLPKPFLPQILQLKNDDDWVDTDLDEPSEENIDEIDNQHLENVTVSVEKVKLKNEDTTI